jgi:hypothetical protein
MLGGLEFGKSVSTKSEKKMESKNIGVGRLYY